MTTIKLKNGSGAPTAGDLVQGEPALDLTNKRLYTEDSGGTVIEVGTNPGTDVTFADNRKAIFGAGSDLKLYHTGSHSYIDENGTGNLYIGSNNGAGVYIQGSGETLASFVDDGAVTLNYDNTARLATTSTGIDVTGTAVTDGLTSAGDAAITGGSSGSTVLTLTSNALADTPLIVFQRDGGAVAGKLAYEDTNTAMAFGTTTSHELKLLANNTRAIQIDSGGDVSLYEDTGTTPKLFWDSSAESLGIGTSSPEETLSVMGDFQVALNTSVTGRGLKIYTSNTSITDDTVSINAQASTGILRFQTNSIERIRVDNSGAVLIHPNNATRGLKITSTTTGTAGDTTTYDTIAAGFGRHVFKTDGTERVRIDQNGNLLVGTTSGTGYKIRSVATGSDRSMLLQCPNGGANVVTLNTSGTADYSAFLFTTDGGNTQTGSIVVGASSTTYNTSSDQRLKENIVDAPSASDDIDAIQVRSFDWKVDGSHQKYGMVAQELQSVAPEAVTGDADSDDMMGVDYSKLVPMMMKEIQSLRARVAELENN